jgi:hypothetical protein
MTTFARERGRDAGIFRNRLNNMDNFTPRSAPSLRFSMHRAKNRSRATIHMASIQRREDITVDRGLAFSVLMSAIFAGGARPALAKASYQ